MESQACNTSAAIRGKRKRLLEVLTDANNETVAEICRKAGISTISYYKYIKTPEIAKFINQATINSCTARKPLAIRALQLRAEKGNVPAIRTLLEIDGTLKSGGNQSVNVAVHKDTEPPTLQIDTPEQLEQAIAQCTAELATLQELIANLKAMRLPGSPIKRLGDGIHPQPNTTTDEEA